MREQNVFRRYEIKYLITGVQKEQIKEKMRESVSADPHGRSMICNIYFDTPSFLLARRSMEGPLYKEKLRLRSYGRAEPDSIVFAEIKKKYQSVVYKRRIGLHNEDAMRYLCEHITSSDAPRVDDCQIRHEIDFFLARYEHLRPAIFLSYEREAFYAKDDHDFRITFDENIRFRNDDLSLCSDTRGIPILRDSQVLLEIKTGAAIPLWMTAILNQNKIYKTSFSKYAIAYQMLLSSAHTGGVCHV